MLNLERTDLFIRSESAGRICPFIPAAFTPVSRSSWFLSYRFLSIFIRKCSVVLLIVGTFFL